ncbi:hypothetical protein [Actinoplanes sp. GCM10030250]|uniref:hypothetical protein n=1 Tax=Actinoplanes sp. GCM10030250 TaxID=3273376 RepID=UPI00361BF7AD
MATILAKQTDAISEYLNNVIAFVFGALASVLGSSFIRSGRNETARSRNEHNQ